jgi:probable HAF family extracellular repeat protein
MKIRSLVVTGALALAIGTSKANAQSYTFTALGTLGGSNSYANAINNVGVVVGYSHIAGNADYHATAWNGSAATDLGTLSGPFSSATAINNAGQIAGEANTSSGYIHAASWNNGAWTDLGTLGGTHSYATAINNGGQVAGYSSYLSGTYVFHATVWTGATVTDLGSPWGTSSFARGINDAGQVAGFSYTAGNGTPHATLWNGNVATDLGTNGGTESLALAINNAGQVAGISIRGANQSATLWNGATATSLSAPWGTSSGALAINNLGQVAGWSRPEGGTLHAALWRDGMAIDLNGLLDENAVSAGWVLNSATGINDSGWIVGNAHNNMTNQDHAFLLAPVPEPETYAMMLAGLGLLGISIRRRNRATVRDFDQIATHGTATILQDFARGKNKKAGSTGKSVFVWCSICPAM